MNGILKPLKTVYKNIAAVFGKSFLTGPVAYSIPFNQMDLSPRTPAAFGKIGIVSKLFCRSSFETIV
jgi:hypothetical protein